MANIQVLKPEISNKIAAGEVVERPASVVKELVENSIDAGATQITVEIKNGGISLISVTDNGFGMSSDDAQIAFLRHATSKIKTEDDLDAIYTLGFRGEALSSIGAVSEAVIYTKRREDQFGTVVTCEGGEIIASNEGGMSDGTKIVVRNLFYNTPARMKFLKKDSTEAGYISDVLNKFVLAHPEISFRFIKNGKNEIVSQGDGVLKNAIYTIYGRDYANNIIEVDYEIDGIKVNGAIGKCNLTRPNRNYQSFFINKRTIKSPLLVRAVEEAFKNQIMVGKFPVAILNVEINPALIDINVHPTKLEVKFSDDKKIYDAVYYATKGALYAIPETNKVKTEFNPRVNPFLLKEEPVKAEFDKPNPIKEELNQPHLCINKAVQENITKEPVLKVEVKNDPLQMFRKNTDKSSAVSFKSPEFDIKIEQPITQTVIEYAKDVENNVKPNQLSVDNINEKLNNVKDDMPINIVGQIFDTYIIAEHGTEMLLVDQHAAHERIKYEQLLSELNNKQCYPQILLEPIVIKVTPDEFEAFQSEYETLNNLGFEADAFGESDIIVRAAPQEIDLYDVEDVLCELLAELVSSKKEIITEKLQRMIYTIACKAAIKANHTLSLTQMESLLKSVFALDNINTCPHGRPITVTITKKELEKMFKRIV